MKIKVILADDHEELRAGFRGMLESAADIEVISEAGNGRDTAALSGYRYPPSSLYRLIGPRFVLVYPVYRGFDSAIRVQTEMAVSRRFVTDGKILAARFELNATRWS